MNETLSLATNALVNHSVSAEEFLRPLQNSSKEATALYRDMSGGKEVPIKVVYVPNFSCTAYSSGTKTGKIVGLHPDYLLPLETAKKLFPKHRDGICPILRQNETMFRRVRKAILAHEIAHLYLNHQEKIGSWPSYVATFLIFPSGLLLIPHFSAIPFFATLFVVRMAALKIFERLRDLSNKHHEFEADLKGLEVTQDLEAFEYFFNTLNRFEPERVFSFTHPSPDQRILYLREHFKPTPKTPIQRFIDGIYRRIYGK